MDNEQFSALRLAAECEAGKWAPNIVQNESALRDRVAAELRRLHAVDVERDRLQAELAAARDLRAELQAMAADECAKASAATKARQAAQAEAEALKERIARSGVDLQRAVWAERERCAKLCDSLGGDIDPRDPDERMLCANSLADAIRTGKQT